MKNKKLIISLGSGAVLLAVIATATFFALFQSGQKTEASLATGKIDVQLVEKFEGSNGSGDAGTNPDSEGLENATKTIKGDNKGSQPAYVRVKIFPQVEEYDDDNGWTICGDVPTNYAKYDINNENWIEDNGYYYYKSILPAGETTSEIVISNLTLDVPDVIKQNIKHKKLRVNMLVEMEATQSSNELYKLNWNIDSLPAGVEQ